MEGNLENQKSEPVLVSRFLDIREKPDINPVLDDFSNIFEAPERRAHFFEEAKNSFEFIFSQEKFVDHIQREPNDESFAYLKQVRRYGLILKASYRFADSSHQCGEALNQFLFLLGQYNDRYWLSPPAELKEAILENLDRLELSVNFIDTSGFREYAKGILTDIETLLQEKRLPVAKFHTLRKNVRLFSNLMQVTAAENYGGAPHWLFHSLFKLSVELGNQHDDLVQKGLQGKIDYHKAKVRIDPALAVEFGRIKPFIEKVCGMLYYAGDEKMAE